MAFAHTRLLGAALAMTTACGSGHPASGGGGESSPMTQQLAADLDVARRARILFAHHSVGMNVLAGMALLDDQAGGGDLRMAWLEEAAALDGPVLAHGGGGRNGDPRSKIDFFAATLRAERKHEPDLAFMKLCYVDFQPSTDAQALFAYYRQTLDALKAEHPGIRFAHVTVPLMARPTDVKSRLRRLAGREVWEDGANARRAEYNRLLEEAFRSDPIFDLAGVESTAPDGTAVSFQLGGRAVPALYAGYTEDGGHLNAAGQRAVGAAAIRFLAEALRAREQATR